MLNPAFLCRYHFLGEHNELHKLVGSLKVGKSVQGYLDKGEVAIHLIKARHEELVREFERRGYNHKSPLPYFEDYVAGDIDLEYNLSDLKNRCERCRKRIEA